MPPRRRRLPRQVYPLLIEASYAKGIVGIVSATRASLAPVMAALPELLESARSSRTDAGGDEGTRARKLVDQARARMAAALSTKQIEDLAKKFATQTATYQRIQLGRQVKAALGVDPLFKDKKLAAMSDHFVAENVARIRTIPTRLHDDVEQVVSRAMSNGELMEDIADDIERGFSVAESDARRIARDQIGKYYGQVNAARQKSIGISRFIWRTAGDERVREEHDAAEKESEQEPYSFDDPPDVGDDEGVLPGEPIQCRCTAEPVFSDVGLEDDDQDKDEPDDDEDRQDASDEDQFLLWCDRCDAYDPDQPRDERGRWGGGGEAADIGEHGKNAREAAKAAVAHLKSIRAVAVGRPEHAELVKKADRLASNARSAARKAEAATTETEAAKHAATAQAKLAEVVAHHASMASGAPLPPKVEASKAPPVESPQSTTTGPAKPLAPVVEKGPPISPAKFVAAYRGVFETGADDRQLTPAQQTQMREHLTDSLTPYGLARNDGHDAPSRSFVVKENFHARGTHDSSGHIKVDGAVAANAAALARRLGRGDDVAKLVRGEGVNRLSIDHEINDYRTHIHEQIHGYGPRNQFSGAYRHEGVYTEETTTEVVARKVTRDQLGLQHGDVRHVSSPLDASSPGSYNQHIDSATRHVQRSMLEAGIHVGYQEAYDHVEQAALRFKMTPQHRDGGSPEGLTRLFAKSFDFTAAAARAGVSLTEEQHDNIRLRVLNRMTVSGGGSKVWASLNDDPLAYSPGARVRRGRSHRRRR